MTGEGARGCEKYVSGLLETICTHVSVSVHVCSRERRSTGDDRNQVGV